MNAYNAHLCMDCLQLALFPHSLALSHTHARAHTLCRLLKSFEFLRDRQRNCQHQRAWRKSLRCTELLVPFAVSVSAWDTGAWIAEVCFNLNNDLQSQTEQRTFLRVSPLNMCPFHSGDSSLRLTECLLGKLWKYLTCCCAYQN